MKEENNKWNMHFGANPVIFERAEELRARMTPAEEILWNVIKINEWHVKFRRQHPLSKYIADFYCHSVKLIIELDGGYHESREVKIYDEARENEMKQLGITVLRFRNVVIAEGFVTSDHLLLPVYLEPFRDVHVFFERRPERARLQSMRAWRSCSQMAACAPRVRMY